MALRLLDADPQTADTVLEGMKEEVVCFLFSPDESGQSFLQREGWYCVWLAEIMSRNLGGSC